MKDHLADMGRHLPLPPTHPDGPRRMQEPPVADQQERPPVRASVPLPAGMSPEKWATMNRAERRAWKRARR